ncbi:MAG: S41 family peptidase, partial [Litorilinea sp.]
VFKRTATESETESANEAASEPEVATDEAVTEDAAAEVALPATHATTGPDRGVETLAQDADDPPGRTRDYITIVTRTLTTENQVRYRQWVNENRRRVHVASDGRIGYVHIPDMGAMGYAEFHRGYLAEVDRDGLIVDVRYNGGGHVSQLILEKLARRRIGYDLSRWGGLIPYPMESIAGPLVALTNEHAGSDGDIFCHSFKLMKLGPLIGKRTWGGVIGIAPQHALVDGTVTTQPEYSFWFEDVGWSVENYGTDPDVEVDNRPQDFAAGVDAQLERAIAEALKLLAENPVQRPTLDARPSRALPTLPPRTTAAGDTPSP